MITETWLIIAGVVAMTIIVVDGKRKKQKGLSTEQKSPQAQSRVEQEVTLAPLALCPPFVGSHIGVKTQLIGVVIADEPMTISGAASGEVYTTHGVTLTSLAYVEGRITARYLECHEGAVVSAVVEPYPAKQKPAKERA
ncbi:polymer-forming cytoskeletal protein [Vreelandella lutescens]|uniref:Uncharacterized protein n=1 Tax=Vreelandella lutescens TaxID=1602943 RepID=A0ABQ1NL30_9GAMM|nr:polymer-forming cytoskeletal protein [Halomonas lutescens]GGC79863.1 hypothetical protein GCM10011382_07380 [Halomonas lutescens]